MVEPETDDSCELGESDNSEALPTNYFKPEIKNASTQCSFVVRILPAIGVQTTLSMLNTVDADVQVEESCFECNT